MLKLTMHAPVFHGAHGDNFQFLRFERLGDVAVRAELHGLHGGFNSAHAGHDHKGKYAVYRPHPLEQLYAADVRHGKITENQIIGTFSHGAPCSLTAGRGLHVPPFAGEQEGEDVQPLRLIIHDQNAILHTFFRPVCGRLFSSVTGHHSTRVMPEKD